MVSPYVPIDICDVVATQGAYLVTRGNTPVWEKDYDEQFAAKLQMHLDALVTGLNCRTVVYHGAADEWPMGYTPPELREKVKAELKALDDIWGYITDEELDNDNGEIYKAAGAVGRENEMSAADRPRMPRQAEGLPTPSMSSESPASTPHKRKRRIGSEDDDKEEERPAKKRGRSAKEVSAGTRDTNTVLDTPQQKSRKRRVGSENDDMGKERPAKKHARSTREASAGARDTNTVLNSASQQKSQKRRQNVNRDRKDVAKGQSRKVSGVTTAHPSSTWMRRLRPRSKRSTC